MDGWDGVDGREWWKKRARGQGPRAHAREPHAGACSMRGADVKRSVHAPRPAQPSPRLYLRLSAVVADAPPRTGRHHARTVSSPVEYTGLTWLGDRHRGDGGSGKREAGTRGKLARALAGRRTQSRWAPILASTHAHLLSAVVSHKQQASPERCMVSYTSAAVGSKRVGRVMVPR